MSFSAFAGLGAYQQKVHCGYCGSENTAHSYGFYSPLMTVQAYEAMLNRGWRRYDSPE
jgi:arginine-tRNA-protein transferase